RFWYLFASGEENSALPTAAGISLQTACVYALQRSWDASILLFRPNDGSQLRKGIYLDFGFTRLIGTETAKRCFRNGQAMIQVTVVVVGRSRESRTREAAGRRRAEEHTS